MNSKFVSLTSGLWIAIAAFAGGATPAESFVAAQFTHAPEPMALVTTGQVATAFQEILGHPYAQDEIHYWRAEGKTVWILEGRGKTSTMTAGFVIQDGRLERAEVLIYRERRGGEIREKSFTRQFEGVSLAEDQRLDRRIDGITGATISVNAMKNLARLALHLNSVIPRD